MTGQEIIECVPNISEGRRHDVIEAIVEPLRSIEGVTLLNVAPDADHNRTVITLIGNRAGLKKAVLTLYREAIPRIDLRQHTGEHPRAGAVDVVPFVPIQGVTMKECVELAHEVAKEVAETFEIPVYLYAEAATRKERESLPAIRKGQFEGWFDKINQPGWEPDYGPRKVHESAGITVIGARMPLIAFNINLTTDDVDIADKIARAVRYSSGGLRYIQAKGMMMHERNLAQVSMNVVNYEKTPLHRVFELVKAEARRYGVGIHSAEIIGLVPLEALLESVRFYLQIHDLHREQILEEEIQDALRKLTSGS